MLPERVLAILDEAETREGETRWGLLARRRWGMWETIDLTSAKR